MEFKSLYDLEAKEEPVVIGLKIDYEWICRNNLSDPNFIPILHNFFLT
jgi:hypothetical protein